MKEMVLEHRGYTCRAIYKNGRWHFGKSTDPNCPCNFDSYADSEEDAKRWFAFNINRMIHHQEFKKTEEMWMAKMDWKSIAAVRNILPEVFERRIENGEFDQTLLDGVEGFDYVVPLYYVTKAWDVILNGTIGTWSFMIGPEEDDDFSEDTLREFMEEEHATRSRAEAIIHNDQMKLVWKKRFGIEIDKLEIDFSQFDMHLPPNVSQDEFDDHFFDVPEGVVEWSLSDPINRPSEDLITHDAVSCLMELVAYILKYER